MTSASGLGIGRCSLVGNSMGGFIATEVAITEPERVDDLDARLRGRHHLGTRPARARGGDRRDGPSGDAGLPEVPHGGDQAAGASRKAYFQGVFFDPDRIRREMLWENLVPALQSPGYYDALTTLWGYDIRDRLEEIDVPTPDRLGPQRPRRAGPAALSYKKRIGDNAELVIFDHCGHVPQIERPVRFNRVLEEFLARKGDLD